MGYNSKSIHFNMLNSSLIVRLSANLENEQHDADQITTVLLIVLSMRCLSVALSCEKTTQIQERP